MWWSAPGKPTSVSSSSPVAGLVGTSCVGEVAVLELDAPPGTGSLWKARKIIRNV